MSVTTYTKDGVADIKELICALVIDLTGQGTPVSGTAAEHMKVVFPEGFDPSDPTALSDDTLVILESTPNIDPFARTDPTVSDPTLDPWRIAFHTSQWTGRSTTEPNPSSGGYQAPSTDPIAINSLAVYVGTPSTLSIDPASGDPTIGWTTTTTQLAPYYKASGSAAINYTNMPEWNFKKSYKSKDLVEPAGNIGARWTNTFDPTAIIKKLGTAVSGSQNPTPVYTSPAKWDGPDVTDPTQLFVNKYVTAGVKAASFGGFAADSNYSVPTSYRVVLTDHGVFIGCWGPDPEENGNGFSWLLVQRPVDKKFGIIRGTPADPTNPGNRPLFCVNSVGGKYWKFVVREHDNPVPSARKDATENTQDSGAVINPYQQQSLTENGEYVITFLNNLNSSRFKYADELDMLGTVSSDVVGGGSEIEVSVYNEEDKRKYHALWSSGSFGTKMRIMVVKDIPTPNVPT
jgi:hypothetical protein